MIIFVTGGAGFIGSNFLNLFVPHYPQHTFINIDKLTYAANLENLSQIAPMPNYHFEKACLTNYPVLDDLFKRYKPDRIIHFAAESHVDRSILGPAEFIQSNIIGTFNLLEACCNNWELKGKTATPEYSVKVNTINNNSIKKESTLEFPARTYLMVKGGGEGIKSKPINKKALPLENEKLGWIDKRFLHVSTDEVYGSLGPEGYFTENTAYDPSSPYSASKASSDHLVRAYHRTYNLPILITNCSNNYGPYQFPEKLIPLMILNALEYKELPVYGKGENVRDWLYVEDHCRALWAVLEKGHPGETYNIGGNNEWKNIAIVKAICEDLAAETGEKVTTYKKLIKFVPDRPGHDLRYAIDSTKIRRELGWKPIESFSAGLQKTIKWYLDNPKWVENVKTGSYRNWLNQNYGKR